MNFKKWVKSIQTAGYNGARTVFIKRLYLFKKKPGSLTHHAEFFRLNSTSGMVIGEFQFQNIEQYFGVHNLYQTIFTNMQTLIRISKE